MREEKTMLTTTLQMIWDRLPKDKKGEPEKGVATNYWQSLLEGLGKTWPDDEPVTLLRILENCGMRSAIATTDAFPGHARAIRLYACYCARRILFYEKSRRINRPLRQIIEVAEKFARGLGSADEMRQDAWPGGSYTPVSRQTARMITTPDDEPEFGNMISYVYYQAKDMSIERISCNYDEARWWKKPWNPANEAAEGKDVEKKLESMLQKFARDRENMRKEFIRLCKLEGEYGEVDRLDNP